MKDTTPEILVEGSLDTRALRDPTAASTVVRGEALREPGVDAARVLARVPGVQTTRSGSSADLTTLSLRGADSAQTPVFLGGIRIQDEATGVADLSRFPLWMLDRIEVYRGTSPEFASRFGVGGAVLLEPRQPQRNEVRGGLEVGSWNTQGAWAGASATSSRRTDDGAGRLGPSAMTSIGYRTTRSDNDFVYEDDAGTAFDTTDDQLRRRTNADYQTHDVWSLSRFAVPTLRGPVRTDVLLNGYGREQGVTGLSQLPAQQARLRTERLLAGLSSRLPCLEDEGACAVELSTRVGLQRQFATDPWRELALGAEWIAQQTERIESRASLRVRPKDELLWGLDAAWETGRLSLDEPEQERTRASEHVLSATALARIEVVRSTGLSLVRTSCLHVRGVESGIQTAIAPCFVEGRVGVKHALAEGLELRSNFSRAVRPPALGERYGVSASTRGNPGLNAEQGWAGDVGLSGTWRPLVSMRWSGELFGFARFAEDLIAYQRSALGYVRPYNVAQARFLGIEGAVNAEMWGHLGLRIHATLMDPRDTSSSRSVRNDLVPLVSRLAAGAEVTGRLTGDHGLFDRAELTLHLDYRGGRVADPAGLIVISQQLVTDISASIVYLNQQVAFRVRLENLFGVSQFDTVGYPLPGRSLYANLELIY